MGRGTKIRDMQNTGFPPDRGLGAVRRQGAWLIARVAVLAASRGDTRNRTCHVQVTAAIFGRKGYQQIGQAFAADLHYWAGKGHPLRRGASFVCRAVLTRRSEV